MTIQQFATQLHGVGSASPLFEVLRTLSAVKPAQIQGPGAWDVWT